MTATLESAVPVLPVRDLAAALDHYQRLGFGVRPYAGDGYGYATRDGVQVNLSHFEQHDPKTTASVLYLYVDDADAPYSEWRDTDIPGRLREPTDTDWRMREGGHVDPDGHLLRLGHHLR